MSLAQDLVNHPLNKALIIAAIWIAIIGIPVTAFFAGDFTGYKRATVEYLKKPTNVYTAPVAQTYTTSVMGYRFIGINTGLLCIGHIIQEKY